MYVTTVYRQLKVKINLTFYLTTVIKKQWHTIKKPNNNNNRITPDKKERTNLTIQI